MRTESKLIHTKSEISEADATGAIGKDSCGNEVNGPVLDDHSCLLENMPSQFDDLYYLMGDFAPTTIKVPTLRNIPCRHNIVYNGKETNADLVNLFNKYIKPKAAATLAAIEAVERSEEGIVDV
ncbi:Inner nuclear membrane protein SRC1 [Colletotrichum sp. SAR 10_70]|nr:Inner nuclear membrane protein SRC1 [Colletotrichum sp. SAR 10_71]KAI8166387.1 Inner nuclear membrane protein SRC1 [Colletotrichum sp. SAR 10_70]